MTKKKPKPLDGLDLKKIRYRAAIIDCPLFISKFFYVMA